MDPSSLIAPENHLGYPAPFWFIEFFKVLGFILHMAPMHLWYAGIIIIMITGLLARGGGAPLRAVKRLANAMPIIVALGINFGVVPLLFTQVAYYQVYYPAGILIAWPWFSVIILLIFSYYGVYIYAINLRKGVTTRLGTIMGWVSALLFLTIGFLFVNNFSLMANPGRWHQIFMASATGGSPNGLALNTGESTFCWRWIMMLGMAGMTVSAFLIVDAAYFAKRDAERYRAELGRFTALIYTLGAAIYAITGTVYIFVTLDQEILQQIWESRVLTVLVWATGALPLIVWILVLLQYNGIKKNYAAAVAGGHFLVLVTNAISRQWVQNTEIGRYFDVTAGKVVMQWGPLFLFLVSFLIGVGFIWWMLKAIKSAKPPEKAFDF